MLPPIGSAGDISKLSAMLSPTENDFFIFVGEVVKLEVKSGPLGEALLGEAILEGVHGERVGLLLSIEVLREPEPGCGLARLGTPEVDMSP